MNLSTSKSFKLVYIIAILTAIVPFGFAGLSWQGLATIKRFFFTFIPFIFLILGLYRIITIVKNPFALNSFPVKGMANGLRKLGIFALYANAFVSAFNLLPVLLVLLFGNGLGVGFVMVVMFVASKYLIVIVGIGTLGLVSFELSRILSFEERARARIAR